MLMEVCPSSGETFIAFGKGDKDREGHRAGESKEAVGKETQEKRGELGEEERRIRRRDRQDPLAESEAQ
jgi:hypothetical protein